MELQIFFSNFIWQTNSFTKKKEVFMLSTDKSWKPSVNFA